MHILYIHQYFKTPEEPGGTRSYWVAKKFLEKGHQVTMLTTSENIEKKKIEKNIDGINVIYVKIPYNQNMSIILRLKSFINFMLKATSIAAKINNVDVVLATSTPLTVGFPALFLKKIRKTPYIFEVRDLWPEVPIQMGALKNRFFQKIAVFFEKTLYKNASHVIALSPGMEDGVQKYISRNKTTMIPNMAKIDKFWPREVNQNLQNKLGLQKDSFKVIHFGALGVANGAISVLKGAEILNDNNVEFVFIGGGAQEEQLKDYCNTHNLSQVHFLGSFSLDKTSEIVNLCDVSIVSFQDLPILYTNSPNKLFDSLSAGKPIIVNSAGWTKEMVEKYECGLYVDPNKPESLAKAIRNLKLNKQLRVKMGNNSRKLAETKYDKSILCNKFVNLVETIIKN